MKNLKVLLLLGLLTAVIGGCGGIKPTVFLHQDYNFAFVERVAVVPFEDLSSDQGASSRATRLFIGQLLAKNAFDVVEPGEVSKAMMKLSISRTAELSKENSKQLGAELGVQAIFLGSVNETATVRSGNSASNVVTMTVRLVETEQGVTVWSASNTTGGKGFIKSLFGAGEKSKAEVMRNCIKEITKTLID